MKTLKIILILLLFYACKDRTIVIQQNDIANFPADKQFTIYKDTYITFTKASKEEKLIRWIKMFSGCTYKSGGEYDCLTAILTYFKSWGANIIVENIPSMLNRIEKLYSIGQLKVRNWREIQCDDIIIFKPNKNGIYHCAAVHDVRNGWIIYKDVNVKYSGMGIQEIEINSDKIKGIYEVSFSLWLGDFLNKGI